MHYVWYVIMANEGGQPAYWNPRAWQWQEFTTDCLFVSESAAMQFQAIIKEPMKLPSVVEQVLIQIGGL